MTPVADITVPSGPLSSAYQCNHKGGLLFVKRLWPLQRQLDFCFLQSWGRARGVGCNGGGMNWV